MGRIPVGGGTAFDRLVGTERILLAQAGGREDFSRPRTCRSRSTISRRSAASVRGRDAARHPARRPRVLHGAAAGAAHDCEERRFGQWESRLVGLRRRRAHSPAFRKLLADGLTRTLVGGRAPRSAPVPAATSCSRSCSTSRVRADAPTACSTAPRATSGSARGCAPARAGRRRAARRAGRGHRLRAGGASRRPRWRGRRCTPTTTWRRCRSSGCGRCYAALRAAEPRLNGLDRLATRWMNGIMFYLDEDVPLVRGPRDLHRLAVGADVDLPGQFWRDVDLRAWRRACRRDLLGRRLRLGDAGAAARQGRLGVHEGGNRRGGLGAAARPISTTALDASTASPGSWTRHRVPEPVGRDQRRAAAGQHAGSWAHRPDAMTGSRT